MSRRDVPASQPHPADHRQATHHRDLSTVFTPAWRPRGVGVTELNPDEWVWKNVKVRHEASSGREGVQDPFPCTVAAA